MRNIAVFRKRNTYACLICNCKEESKLQEITINRHCHSSSVITFEICDDCLTQLKLDIETYIN